jgi:hypothetical protein
VVAGFDRPSKLPTKLTNDQITQRELDALINQCNRNCLAAFLRLHDLHFKSLPLVKRTESSLFDNGDVDEYVFAAIFGACETEAFVAIKPLHSPFDVGGCRGIRTLAARPNLGG